MSAHTPGPWEIGYLDKHGQRLVRGQHIEICTCWHHSALEKEMEANASLIAAAPDLLAALEDSLDSLEYVAKVDPVFSGWGVRQQRIAAAKAAVAKAKGEG